jgi:hypothetical protein
VTGNRRFWRWVVLGVVVAVVAGAGYWFLRDDRVPLTRAEVVGVWCGPGGSSISFAADGAFSFAGVDNNVLRPAEKADGFSSGSGTWVLAAPIVDRKGPLTQVDMTFRTMNGRQEAYGNRLRSERGDGRLTMYYFIGDPDSGRTYLFRRGTMPCSKDAM